MSSDSKFHYGWIIAAGGFITQIPLLMSTTILPIVLVLVKQELGISAAEVGLIVSVRQVFQIIGFVVGGLTADRIGLRKTLTVGCLLTSIGIMSMGLMSSLETGILAYALSGFGGSALSALIPKITRAWFETQRRGIASSIIASGGMVTMSTMGLVVPLLAATNGWRFPFLILGTLSLFLSTLIYVIMRDSPEEKGLSPVGATFKAMEKIEDPEENLKEPVGLQSLLRRRVTWHLGVMYIFYTIGFLAIMTYFVSYLIETGLSLTVAGSMSSLFSICMLLSQFLCGLLSDRIPRKVIISIMGFLQALFMAIFLVLPKGVLTDYVMVGLIGLSGGFVPVTWAMFSDYFHPRLVGTATGLVMSMGGIGSAVAIPIAGSLAVMTQSLAITLGIVVIVDAGMAATALVLKNPNTSS